MSEAEFRKLRAEIFNLYQQGAYAQALEILNVQAGRYPQHSAQAYNWRMCLTALLDQPQQAIQIFERALDQGLWYSEATLREDTDLASLQGQADFEKLVEISKTRHEQARAHSRAELHIQEPAPGAPQPYPLLVAFHGRNGNAKSFADYWEPLTTQGWLVALPQSSQIICPSSYCWDDPQLSRSEILEQIAVLRQKYPLDLQRLVMAGFSQGAGLAIWLALEEETLGHHFIAVAPYLRGVGEIQASSEKKSGEIRGYLILGEQDPNKAIFDEIDALLETRGTAIMKEQHADLGHDFPADFEQSLQRALHYLLESS